MPKLLAGALLGLGGYQSSAQAGNFTLVYHQVGKGSSGTLGISAADLEQRIVSLKKLGYRFITSSQIRRSTDKTAVLEFDDGFESVYTQALPVLKKWNVPGSAYPILNLIGKPGHMTQAQLDALRAAGWEVGSHTHNHADLTSLTPKSLKAELEPGPLQDPQNACVAYPFSLFDTRTRRAAQKVYGCGVGGGQGNWGGPYSLPGPQITPWDSWLLPYRAPLGLDGRTPIFAVGAAFITRDLLRAATLNSGRGADLTLPPFWNPARYEMLGRGDYQTGTLLSGGHYGLLEQRMGHWVLEMQGGANDIGGASVPQGTLSAAYNLPQTPLTLSVGVGVGTRPTPIFGVSTGLGGYGEGWLRYAGHLTAGLEVIPLDYLRLRAEYDALSGLAVEGIYALPLDTGEGHPYRVLAGYNPQAKWYVGGLWQLGSYSLRAAFSPTRPALAIGFESRW